MKTSAKQSAEWCVTTRSGSEAPCSRTRPAAREYARAADIARREGHLASGTSWMLATAHYYNGNLVGAAAALDQLTDEAARVGDLEVEALSIYYAAWLDGKAGRGAEMAARVARLEGLLRSQLTSMANLCEVCGQPCGWWRTVHRECEPQKAAIDHTRFAEHRREEQAAAGQYPIAAEELGRRLGEHLWPVEEAPTLFSIYGIGTRMHGRARYDEVTDSYVATRGFVCCGFRSRR